MCFLLHAGIPLGNTTEAFPPLNTKNAFQEPCGCNLFLYAAQKMCADSSL
jgi:hypothetical protein